MTDPRQAFVHFTDQQMRNELERRLRERVAHVEIVYRPHEHVRSAFRAEGRETIEAVFQGGLPDWENATIVEPRRADSERVAKAVHELCQALAEETQ